MREILFGAKEEGTKQWVKGYYRLAEDAYRQIDHRIVGKGGW